MTVGSTILGNNVTVLEVHMHSPYNFCENIKSSSKEHSAYYHHKFVSPSVAIAIL